MPVVILAPEAGAMQWLAVLRNMYFCCSGTMDNCLRTDRVVFATLMRDSTAVGGMPSQPPPP